jgi:hypothetical protein
MKSQTLNRNGNYYNYNFVTIGPIDIQWKVKVNVILLRKNPILFAKLNFSNVGTFFSVVFTRRLSLK